MTRSGAAPSPAVRSVLVVVLLIVHAGCGYRLSGRNRFLPPDVHTIAIPVFEDETRRAEIGQRITESLLEEFIKRGPYLTQPQREGADAILEGAITGYSETPVSLDPKGREQRREIVVQARVRLTDLRTGGVLWTQEHFIFRGQYELAGRSGTGSPGDPVAPPGARRTGELDRNILAIERIARDFSETVVTSILEGF